MVNFFNLIKPFLVFFYKFLFICIFLIIPFAFMFIFFVFKFYFLGYRFKHSTRKQHLKKHFLLYKIFFDFPRRFVLDLYNRNFDDFNYYGIWLFVGEQGSGKSIAVAEMIRRIKLYEYTKCKVMSNIGFKYADDKILEHKDIIYSNNGSNGSIIFLDEVQNWFASAERVNFPVELIQEICQQRKQHKMLIATTQCFNRVSLSFRQQVNYLCEPITILGCFTIVRVYKPVVSLDGNIKKKRLVKCYCFVHDDDLRCSYDTFEKVRWLSLKDYNSK